MNFCMHTGGRWRYGKKGGKKKVKKAKGWRLEVKGRDNEIRGNLWK